jgi:predicted nucleic-acid-binding Zn-ribbon protein
MSSKKVTVKSCPKCGGNMAPRNFIVGPNEVQKIVQCRLCQFYIKLKFK